MDQSPPRVFLSPPQPIIINTSQQKYQKKFNNNKTMDIFDFPDDYKPEKYLTTEQAQQNTNYLLNHPLFMKSLPEDPTTNEHLAALMALKEDEDPNQVAENLNKMANKKLKESPNGLYHMKEAYQRYTQGINLKCSSPQINAKLHANRAQLNLKLRNYGKVVTDCKMCLKYDPNYVKGYYRYAKALLALEKYEECTKLLADRKEEELQELLAQAGKKGEEKMAVERKKKQQKEEKLNQIQKYCQEKGWKYLKRDQPLPQGVKAQIKDKNLSIPLLVLYPEFSEFDMIASTFEDHKLKQHISQVLENGLPWDTKHEYSLENIQIYCQVSQAVIMKIPKQAKIGDILARVPFKQALEVQVVRKDNSFYKNFITQYKII